MKKRKGPVETTGPRASVDADRPAERRHALSTPVGVEQRVERLIEVPSVAEERPAQNAFLHRAQLLQRAVAAAVQDRGARFEAMHAERVENEFEHELRAVLKHPGAPERLAQRKSPLGVLKPLPEIPHLEDADRGVEAAERDREAHVRT